jgi:hypothetical protein
MDLKNIRRIILKMRSMMILIHGTKSSLIHRGLEEFNFPLLPLS